MQNGVPHRLQTLTCSTIRCMATENSARSSHPSAFTSAIAHTRDSTSVSSWLCEYNQNQNQNLSFFLFCRCERWSGMPGPLILQIWWWLKHNILGERRDIGCSYIPSGFDLRPLYPNHQAAHSHFRHALRGEVPLLVSLLGRIYRFSCRIRLRLIVSYRWLAVSFSFRNPHGFAKLASLTISNDWLRREYARNSGCGG